MLNNAWPTRTPHPLPLLSFPSFFIYFIFLLSVPQALTTPHSRLTAGWNWDWQSRVMVAGYQGLTVKEKVRESRWVICHCVNGVATLSIDLSEWALELYQFRGAVELDWFWKLESEQNSWNSILAWTKPVNSLIISCLFLTTFRDHCLTQNVPVPVLWGLEYEISCRHNANSVCSEDTK